MAGTRVIGSKLDEIFRNDNYRRLRELAFSCGCDLFGACDVKALKGSFNIEPESVLDGLDLAISLGVRLSDKVVDTIGEYPTEIYSYHYRRINIFLDSLSVRLNAFIQGEGYNSLPIPSSQIIDWESSKAHLSHRLIAHLAGHGWIGRSGLLVNPHYGSRVRFVTILTDMPLRTDRPIDGGCGNCRRCIPACPAKAICDRVEDFKFERCSEKLREFSRRPHIGHRICGICVRACRGNPGLEKRS